MRKVKRIRHMVVWLMICVLVFASKEANAAYVEYKADTVKELQEVMRSVMLKKQEDIKITLNPNIDVKKINFRVIGGMSHEKKNFNDGIELVNGTRYAGYTYIPGTMWLELRYYDTYEETKATNKKINSLYKKLKLKKGTRKAKVKRIHDYIVDSFSYDNTFRNYTAYDMLRNGKGVCYSYASLFYKLCVKAGIPCVIVNGTYGAAYHSWNYVKIGGRWRFIDVTFDDTGRTRRYFLLSATPAMHKVLGGFEECRELYKAAYPKFYKEFLSKVS